LIEEMGTPLGWVIFRRGKEDGIIEMIEF